MPEQQKKEYDANTGDWGSLPEEPCRKCHQRGGVMFQIDDGPEGRTSSQAVRCTLCGATWHADGPYA